MSGIVSPFKAIAIVCALMSAVAFVGSARSEPQRPAAPAASNSQPSGDSDRLFARQAARDGMGEVFLGRFAKERASRPEVREFAARMVEVYGRLGDELAKFAKAAKIALPKEMGPTNIEKHNYLKTFSGADFDREYMNIQIADHQQMIKLFQWLSSAGQDPAMKTYVAGRLPTLTRQLEKANEIQARIIQASGGASASDAQSAGMDGDGGRR